MGDVSNVTDDPTDQDRSERQRRASVERYLETKRARPAIRPTPSAGLAVNRVMRPLASKGKSRGSSALALGPIWSEIMGPRWSKISAPIRFKATGGRRTLIISAPGAASALIQAASGQIIERLNAHLGAGHVHALQIVQAKQKLPSKEPAKRGLTPSEDAALKDGLSKIKQDRLRAALESLGREIIRKN